MTNSVVCWLWNDPAINSNFKTREFRPQHVNILQRMIARHLPQPHRFICISDDANGLDTKVEWLRTPNAAIEVGKLRSPEGHRFPSCYRRLWAFSKDAALLLGDRALFLDIDLVVTNDLTPIFNNYPGDFVGWQPYRDWGKKLRFGGGLYLMKLGTRTNVWESFRGERSIRAAREQGYRGSDQAWISYMLAETDSRFGLEAGLYSIRDLNRHQQLPKDARIVQFNGNCKPWQSHLDWVKQHWR